MSRLLGQPRHEAELWLEFDLVGEVPAPGEPEPPSLFVAVDDADGRPPRLGSRAEPAQRRAAAYLDGMLEALGCDTAAVATVLRLALSEMPASTRLSYLGCMLARGEAGCRLVFDAMPLDGSCTHLLEVLGLSGWRSAADVVASLAALVSSAALHVDVDDSGGLGPRLGFELPVGVVDAPALSDYATDSERAALRTWPTERHRLSNRNGWPAVLRGANHLRTSVNHVKVIVDADAGELVELKAYLGMDWSRSFPHPRLWGGEDR